MAGHSKWANTKHRKAAQDAKRGKIFTKIIRELVTAARLGGGDPGASARARRAGPGNASRTESDRRPLFGAGGVAPLLAEVLENPLSALMEAAPARKISISPGFLRP